MSQRDARELRTLATCLDLLAGGRLAEVGDHLMQRFKSVETTASRRSLELGRHQELIPELNLGVTSLKEQEFAAKMTLRNAALKKVLQSQGGARE